MKIFVSILVLMLATYSNGGPANIKLNPLSDEFIEHVNGLTTTWKAGRNFHEKTSMEYIRRLMGVLEDNHRFLPPKMSIEIPENFEFPESFDARDEWPQCTSIGEIRDQGSCGSCWAISSVEVMTDRQCIFSNGENNFHYSTEDLMTCCDDCGSGCNGGYTGVAFKFWGKVGIVSGGPYNSMQGCQPYEIAPCEHHISGELQNCTGIEPTPKCNLQCEENYPIQYYQDKHLGSSHYSMSDESSMMKDLLENGPFVASFSVYEDFLTYKSGVYQHTTGGHVGNHAIRVLGYGVENGTPYWFCANSWNAEWGDKGYFKILRGKDECDIEDAAVAGNPKIKN